MDVKNLAFFALRRRRSLWNDFRKEAADWLDDAEIYSLHDLARVNSGELQPLLRAVVTHGIKHVIDCEVRHFRRRLRSLA